MHICFMHAVSYACVSRVLDRAICLLFSQTQIQGIGISRRHNLGEDKTASLGLGMLLAIQKPLSCTWALQSHVV